MRNMKQKLFGLLLAALATINLAALAVPTVITAVVPKNGYSNPTATQLDVAWTASDNVNGNSVALTGREIVFLWNSDASPRTVTFTSVADPITGRSGDITAYSIGAGLYSVIGPFNLTGFAQSSDGTLRFTTSNALVKVIVLRLPSLP